MYNGRCFHLLLFVWQVWFCHGEYYSYDGSGNNLNNNDWGQFGIASLRLSGEADVVSFADGIGEMDDSLPNPREMSNMFGQLGITSSSDDDYTQLTMLAFAFGTTVSFDLCQNKMNFTSDNYVQVDIPTCDYFWDSSCESNKTMPFYRTKAQYSDNVRAQTLYTSSYLDMSFLYGSNDSNFDSIRTFENGHLRTSSMSFNTTEEFIVGIYGSDKILDYYDASSLNSFITNIGSLNLPSVNYESNGNTLSNITQCPLFSSVSISSGLPNIVPMYTMQTLFALEHNRIADELSKNYSDWTDERLFYEARQFNIALFQHITYNEYIPMLLAKNYNNMGLSYNDSIDATTSNLFCSVGMRYAHGKMSNNLAFGGNRDGKTWGTPNFGGDATNVVAEVAFRDTFSRPCLGIQEIGTENYLTSLISGMMLSTENVISPKYCEEVRSFLSVAAAKTSDSDIKNWDLFAVDVLRSRDNGIPSYNDARELFGLSTISSFSDLTTNKFYLNALNRIYDSVDDLDAIVGAFIESVEASDDDTSNGSGQVGALFANILNEQFYRTYVGDRLFYRWNSTLLDFVDGTLFSDIISRNTDLTNASYDTFQYESTANGLSSTSTDDGYNTITLLSGNYQLYWKLVEDGDELVSEGITDYLDIKISVSISSSSDVGWIGLGYGDSPYMNDKDISKVVYTRSTSNGEETETFACMDTYSTDWKPAYDNSWSTGTQDIYDCAGSFEDDIVTVAFKRPLSTDDPWDNDIPVNEITYFIAAYNDASESAKHDTNKRTPGKINWSTGDASSVSDSDTINLVRLYHGLTMIALFLFAYPISSFIARYLRYYPFWREAHKMIGSLGVMSCITSAYIAFSTVSDRTRISRTHNAMGLTCVILLVTQVVGGYGINFWLLNRSRGTQYRYIHYGHLGTATCILFISPWTCYEGWISLKPDDIPALETPVTWYLILFTLIAIGELFRKLYSRCSDDSALEVFRSNFHVFTWDQIGEKVSAGAAWLVIGKYVYDVTSWQASHPGGRRILLDYIGTDCTEMFFGRQAVGEAHGGISYAHSARAVKQMTQMVVGEIPLEETNEYLQRKRKNGDELPGTAEEAGGATTNGVIVRGRTGSFLKKSNLNAFTDRIFHKYASLYENAPLVLKRGETVNSKEKKPLSPKMQQNMEMVVGQLAKFSSVNDDESAINSSSNMISNSNKNENEDDNDGDGMDDIEHSYSTTYGSLLGDVLGMLDEERDGVSHVKADIDMRTTTARYNDNNNNNNDNNETKNNLEVHTELAPIASHSADHHEMENDNDDNNDNKPKSPSMKRLFTSSSLHPQYSKRARAGTLETLQIDQLRFKQAKRFRSLKLIYKCKLTHEASKRPIMLLEWDISHLALDNQPGEYLFLHHIGNDAISRAYTPVPSHFVLCNNEKFISEIENARLNRKFSKIKDSKIAVKDRFDRIFLMVRIYPHGRMSKVLSKLKPGRELRVTGPFVRQKVLPRLGKDYGYGDRCWRHLVMIAGGTGFTPMLDALVHHLEYGNDDVKLLFVWFNRRPIDLCCLEQFEWFVNEYPNRFYVNLVFSEPAEDPIDQDIVQLWKQRVACCIYYNKWNATECVDVISKFFENGKVTDIRIQGPVATSIPMDAAKLVKAQEKEKENDKEKKVEMVAQNENDDDDDDDASRSGTSGTNANDNNNNNNTNGKFQLNKHDRIILSGPKLFVENFLLWIRDGEVFEGTNIGRQIICYD